MTGTIPAQFKYSTISKVSDINLSTNFFSGTIPAWISQATSLKKIYSSFNNFIGPVPDVSSLHELDTCKFSVALSE